MGLCMSSGLGFGTEEHINQVVSTAGISELVLAIRQLALERWQSFRVGKDGRVSAKIAFNSLKMSRYLPQRHVEAVCSKFHLFDSFDSKAYVQLFEQAHLSLPRVDALFAEADEHGVGYIGTLELKQFIRSNYEGHITDDECAEIIRTYQNNGRKVTTPIMTIEGFMRMLSDAKRNTVLDTQKTSRVYQDMSYPLSEYFICSSHNTYLSGNQWSSKSSGEAIKRALLLGVRVIELDSWEDVEGNPIVNHGNGTTLCTPATFQECVEAVRDYAFKTSVFPVILTIENHCGLEAQRKQAKILRDVLGETLFNFQRDGLKEDLENLIQGPEEWLSPHELQQKVVIRDKPIKKTKKKDTTKARRASALLEKHQQRKSLSLSSLSNLPAIAMSLASYNSYPSQADDPGKHFDALQFPHSPQSSDSLVEMSQYGKRKKSDKGSKTPKSNGSQFQDEGPGKTYFQVPLQASRSLDISSDDESGDSPEESEMIEVPDLEAAAEAALQKANRRSSVRKRISKRVSKSFRPISGNLGRVSSIVSNASSGSTGSDESELDERVVEHLTDITETVKLSSAARELLQLIYVKNVKLRFKVVSGSGIVFEEPDYKTSSSLDEKKLTLLTKGTDRQQSVQEYTKRHLLRVYPAGQRVDSSNFNPVPAWNAGCQMVALNYQTNSQSVWMSQGKFIDNGGCGYILKPPNLRRFATGMDKLSRPDLLSVKIISGHYLMQNFAFESSSNGGIGGIQIEVPESVFVEIAVAGKPMDCKTFRTRQIRKNCFNPTWNQVCRFPVEEPDFAILSINVWDQDENLIGQMAMPITCIRSGYRVVPLRSASSVPLGFSALFCKFEHDQT